MGGAKNRNRKSTLTIGGLVSRYELSNIAEGKSPKTITWYSDILRWFISYLKLDGRDQDISSFTIDNVRRYVLYLQDNQKFLGHPYTPVQSKPVSPHTFRCFVT